jgi:small ligand-binding sensory domain FIST
VAQTFRFHVRYVASADAELATVVRDGAERLAGPPGGALLFSCSGRGSQMFSRPDHDARELAGLLGVPTAGIFCQGEIGPVGGSNHLHGFTATVALFPS